MVCRSTIRLSIPVCVATLDPWFCGAVCVTTGATASALSSPSCWCRCTSPPGHVCIRGFGGFSSHALHALTKFHRFSLSLASTRLRRDICMRAIRVHICVWPLGAGHLNLIWNISIIYAKNISRFVGVYIAEKVVFYDSFTREKKRVDEKEKKDTDSIFVPGENSSQNGTRNKEMRINNDKKWDRQEFYILYFVLYTLYIERNN